jgi:DNA-binding FadR family transcriptional regulator
LEQPDGQQHFQEARSFFEIGLARYAARNATKKDLAQMEAALAANRASINDLPAFKRTDIEFHFVLAEIPRNPIFPAIHDAMVDWLTDQRDVTLQIEAGADRLQGARAHLQGRCFARPRPGGTGNGRAPQATVSGIRERSRQLQHQASH